VRLTSADPRAQEVKALANAERYEEAGWTLQAFVAPDGVPNHNVAVRGLVRAEVFNHAVSRKGVAIRALPSGITVDSTVDWTLQAAVSNVKESCRLRE